VDARDECRVDSEVRARRPPDGLDRSGENAKREGTIALLVGVDHPHRHTVSAEKLLDASMNYRAVARQQRLARDLVVLIEDEGRLLGPVCMRNVMMFFEYI
jgi:hypothetical protein